MTRPRLLITGGAGFVGTNLVLRLKDKFDIVVVDNFSTGSQNRGVIEPHCEILELDITVPGALDDLAESASHVVHLAAKGSVIDSVRDPVGNLQTNVAGTLNLLMSCSKGQIKQFVMASTGGALMGNCALPANEASLPKPISPYGASKLACEGYCSAFSALYSVPITVLRFSNVYGPFCDHKKGVVNVLFDKIHMSEPMPVYGDGSASRDFVHASDICQAIELALLSDNKELATFHVSTGIETSMLALIDIMQDVAGKSLTVKYCPKRTGEVEQIFASSELASDVLGFKPNVSLQEGLKDLWHQMRKQDDS